MKLHNGEKFIIGLKAALNSIIVITQCRLMEGMFQQHHPKNGLRPGRGLFSSFFALIKKEFDYYDDKVLLLVTKIFTRFRCRTINKLRKLKKKKGPRKTKDFKLKAKLEAKRNKAVRKRAPVTDRGKIKLAKRTL